MSVSSIFRAGLPRPNRQQWPKDRSHSTIIVVMIWIVFLALCIRFDWLKSSSMSGGTGQAIKLGLFALSAMIVLRRWNVAVRTLKEANTFFLVFLAMVPLSAAWSLDPNVTISRFVGIMTFVTLSLAAVLTNWYRERFQDIWRPLMTAICVGSLIVGLAYPDWVIEGGLLGKAWHGLLDGKNYLGQAAGFAMIFWFHGWLTRTIGTGKAAAGVAIGLAVLLLSRSSTSLMAMMFSFMLMLMLMKSPRAMKRSMKLVVILFAIVVLLYAVAILKIVPGLDILLEPVMMISGKDMTFSNRSAIWEIIKEDMQNWPVLGAGYFAYWTGPDDLASPSHKFIARLFFYPFACHNGYLEVANDLGYVGLTVLLGYLAFFARQAIQLFLLERSQGTLYLGLFFHQCVINLSESEWFQVGQIMNILLMTTATFAMARTLAEYKRTGQLPPPRRV